MTNKKSKQDKGKKGSKDAAATGGTDEAPVSKS